ncbi:MAG: sulfite exporter TauE/SafE family protein [Acidimicrobiia bacterium]|nr:sulfite exporter TauE/SafE family protein [Acidimicrobiia bacterium]
MAFVAVAAGAFVKGVTGSGLPLIGIPFMASFLGVEHAVVVMLIPTAVANAWMVWANREAASEARHLWPMYLLGVVGTASGTWILVSFDDRWLSLALAAMIVLYATVFFAKPDLQFTRKFTDRANAPLGLAAGVLQGSTGLSGPIVATYFHGFRMARTTYLFTVTAMYGLFGATQIVALIGFGSFTLERFWQGMATLIPLALALPPGLRLSARISHTAFERSVLFLLLVVSIRLVWNSFAG